jgi:hypothetical protein
VCEDSRKSFLPVVSVELVLNSVVVRGREVRRRLDGSVEGLDACGAKALAVVERAGSGGANKRNVRPPNCPIESKARPSDTITMKLMLMNTATMP